MVIAPDPVELALILGRVLERLGVLKVQGRGLDRGYLARTADDLDLADLLTRALAEAGLAQVLP